MREVLSGRNVRFNSHRLFDGYLEVTVWIHSLETLVYRTEPAPVCRVRSRGEALGSGLGVIPRPFFLSMVCAIFVPVPAHGHRA